MNALTPLLTTLEASSVRLWPAGGNLHYRTPGPIPPELREAIAANKPALIELLGTWDTQEATRLQVAADGLVERLGCRGDDPVIQEHAREYVTAFRRCDMPGVRAGCAKVEARARELANAGSAKAA